MKYKFELGNYGTRNIMRQFVYQVCLWIMINFICKTFMKFIIALNIHFLAFSFGWLFLNESLTEFV